MGQELMRAPLTPGARDQLQNLCDLTMAFSSVPWKGRETCTPDRALRAPLSLGRSTHAQVTRLSQHQWWGHRVHGTRHKDP